MNFLSILALLLSSTSGIKILSKDKTHARATTKAASTVKVASKDYMYGGMGNYGQ
jgi:hypothetical protein